MLCSLLQHLRDVSTLYDQLNAKADISKLNNVGFMPIKARLINSGAVNLSCTSIVRKNKQSHYLKILGIKILDKDQYGMK